MLTNLVWSVFKDHLRFLSTQDKSFLSKTFENWFVLFVFVIDLFPFIFVALSSWVDSHESLGVLDLSTETFEFNNLEFAVNWSHVFFFSVSIVASWKLKVNNWSFSNTFDTNL
jgi:hypothetical protein